MPSRSSPRRRPSTCSASCCPRSASCAAGVDERNSCPTSRAIPPPDSSRRLPTVAELGTVIVTGGASGLGAAVARAVADRGGEPVVMDVNPPQNGFTFEGVDLSQTRAAEAAVERVAQERGGIDAVVTAAGVDACGRIEDVDADEWERVVAVNLLGTAAVIR